MLTHEIVQHGWFPNALGTTDHQEGRGAQSFTLRWIDEVLDVFLLDQPCRGGLCPFQPLPSLPHCPVHEEARKEPLNESLENQHYEAPCAQQRPTSFNRLRRKKPLRAVFVDDRLEGRTGLAQAQPASQRCICGMSKERDNTSFSQFVPNWLWYWRMLDMQNQTGTTAPNLNQYMNLKQIIRHLWTTAW